MKKYYVNTTAQTNGDHEVHEDGCYWLSLVSSKKDLGEHASCKGAVAEAKKTYPSTANGCRTCCTDCHTT
jgi:hypothetical protein